MKSEAELAEKVVDFLQDQGWEIYQEVKVKYSGGIADIVAVRGPIVWIVECKLNYGLPVIYQARNWVGKVHYVSVAVLPSRNFSTILDEYCRWKGIGRIQVRSIPIIEVQARLTRRPVQAKAIMADLCEEQKTFAKAGNNNSRFYSPYQRTCDQIRKVVKLRPGISLKELVSSIDHHYASIASARGSISFWAQKGKISGIEAKKESGRILLYPNNDEILDEIEVKG